MVFHTDTGIWQLCTCDISYQTKYFDNPFVCQWNAYWYTCIYICVYILVYSTISYITVATFCVYFQWKFIKNACTCLVYKTVYIVYHLYWKKPCELCCWSYKIKCIFFLMKPKYWFWSYEYFVTKNFLLYMFMNTMSQ